MPWRWLRRLPARCSIGTTTTASDPDKAVCFHCSNLPKHFFNEFVMDFQAIIAGTVGKENTFGTVVGRVKAGRDDLPALLHGRLPRQDPRLCWRRRIHKRSAGDLWRGGVVKIPHLQKLLHMICEQGFEHHVAANFSQVSSAVHEAAVRYLGWEMYLHDQEGER